ncbi:MAG: cation transporter [Chthonomonadaceae bacterium]|nr:cation transporter [Chthonomonadaceae bacterium]
MHPTHNLLRRGLLLEYITLGWNVVGVTVVIYAAWHAHSVALAGFGLDSLIEIGASTVVIWELTGTGKDREKKAMRLIGAAFFALALYILLQTAQTLCRHVHPDTSPLGMVWLVFTFAVMVALAQGKRRTGTQLNNPVLLTEGRVTMVDAYLAGSVLVGLLFNALFGWWWADPLAGMVIVVYGFKEGLHAWREGNAH